MQGWVDNAQGLLIFSIAKGGKLSFKGLPNSSQFFVSKGVVPRAPQNLPKSTQALLPSSSPLQTSTYAQNNHSKNFSGPLRQQLRLPDLTRLPKLPLELTPIRLTDLSTSPSVEKALEELKPTFASEKFSDFNLALIEWLEQWYNDEKSKEQAKKFTDAVLEVTSGLGLVGVAAFELVILYVICRMMRDKGKFEDDVTTLLEQYQKSESYKAFSALCLTLYQKFYRPPQPISIEELKK